MSKRITLLLSLMGLPALAFAGTPYVPSFDLQNPTARCGNVLYFAGGSALDGPAYYTDTQGNILCKAGGTCRGRVKECIECISRNWSCETPQPAQPERQ